MVNFNETKQLACIVSDNRDIDYPFITIDDTTIVPFANLDSLGMYQMI